MSKRHSRASDYLSKPAKPYEDFPLFPHNNGCWAKKIRGKLHYFGPWNDPDGALANYLKEKDDLHAGRTPRPDPQALTVKDAANAFLNAKQALLDAGELAERTWREYKRVCDLLVSELGRTRLVSDLRAEDFARLRDLMAGNWGPVRVGNVIQYVRSVFKFAFDAELIQTPVRFGPGFKRPAKKVIRLHKARQGPCMFEAEEIRWMLGGALVPGKEGPELARAGMQLRAMILLAINCGFGNADCGTLPLSALNLERGWINYPRPKTGIPRRCPLWSETVAAIREALAKRPEPRKAEHGGLVFITKYGDTWNKGIEDSPISKETRKLLDRLGINGHRSFYALRHTFETIGGEAKDQIAVDHVMGHAREDMASIYRERISDERLRAVTDHVRAWLFGTPADQAESAPTRLEATE
jgi:integrase